jgi:hypothetical protein
MVTKNSTTAHHISDSNISTISNPYFKRRGWGAQIVLFYEKTQGQKSHDSPFKPSQNITRDTDENALLVPAPGTVEISCFSTKLKITHVVLMII